MGLSAEKKVRVVLIAALFNQLENMARPIFYVVVRLLRGDVRSLLCRCMYKVYRLNLAAFIGNCSLLKIQILTVAFYWLKLLCDARKNRLGRIAGNAIHSPDGLMFR